MNFSSVQGLLFQKVPPRIGKYPSIFFFHSVAVMVPAAHAVNLSGSECHLVPHTMPDRNGWQGSVLTAAGLRAKRDPHAVN